MIPWKNRPWTYKVKVYMYEYGRRVKMVAGLYWPEWAILGSALVILYMLSGCLTQVIEPEEVITPSDVGEFAEAYCAANPELPCGHVYECSSTLTPELPQVEICILDDHPITLAEELHGGSCKLSTHERFDGYPLCWWCCGEGCSRGCNAYEGCFCPVSEPEPEPEPTVPEDPYPVPPRLP